MLALSGRFGQSEYDPERGTFWRSSSGIGNMFLTIVQYKTIYSEHYSQLASLDAFYSLSINDMFVYFNE